MASQQQLHDIEGLDLISSWPLAIGWWLLIFFAIFLAAVLIVYLFYKLKFKRSWKNFTLQKLALLEENLSDATARETAVILSEYLRRIALMRFSRKECAGLNGEAWLKWLSIHDPKNFDWEKRGAILIEIPYAPIDVKVSASELKKLVEAAKYWVR